MWLNKMYFKRYTFIFKFKKDFHTRTQENNIRQRGPGPTDKNLHVYDKGLFNSPKHAFIK